MEKQITIRIDFDSLLKIKGIKITENSTGRPSSLKLLNWVVPTLLNVIREAVQEDSLKKLLRNQGVSLNED